MIRRTPWRAALPLVVGAACAADGPTPPRLERATPAYGPLVGGTRITVTGVGFAATAPTRVLVAGREAPLVATVDDTTLEVVLPPGAQPGDAELVVWNDRGNDQATGLFHYSEPPVITAVTPAAVLFTSTTTRMTITGAGFRAEGAGDVAVVVGGLPVADVEVISDTAVTFTAPPGRPLAQPDLELIDRRGRAVRPRGFRYVPSPRGGLLLFPSGGAFAVFFDPVDHTTVTIPWVGLAAVRFTAVVRDDRGDYWGADRSRRFGRIDMTAQRLEAPISTAGWFPTMIRVGADHYALERGQLRFGALDPRDGSFRPIGAATLPCCGSYGLAADGAIPAAAYLVARDGVDVNLHALDLTTGTIGPGLPITGPSGFQIEEMRFFRGALYASTRAGALVTIDPRTGTTAVVEANLGRFTAMEVFE